MSQVDLFSSQLSANARLGGDGFAYAQRYSVTFRTFAEGRRPA